MLRALQRRRFATFLLGSVSPPAQPTGLTATPSSTSQIDLAWTDNATNETAYKVYRSTNGVDYSQVGDDLAADANSYSDTTISAGTIYYYKVAAVNAAGETLSDSVTASTLTFGLLAYWKYDETTGNRVDSVGSRDLAPQGTVSSQVGKIGNAAQVSGASNYLTNTSANLTGQTWSGGFSVVGWLYIPTAYSDRNAVLSRHTNTALYTNSASQLYFLVYDSVTGSSLAIASGLTINVDTWYFVAGRYNSSTKKAEVLFNDGTWQVASAALTNEPKNTSDRIDVGQKEGDFGNAAYDETGLYTRYLSDTEVTALYNGGAGRTYPFPP